MRATLQLKCLLTIIQLKWIHFNCEISCLLTYTTVNQGVGAEKDDFSKRPYKNFEALFVFFLVLHFCTYVLRVGAKRMISVCMQIISEIKFNHNPNEPSWTFNWRVLTQILDNTSRTTLTVSIKSTQVVRTHLTLIVCLWIVFKHDF